MFSLAIYDFSVNKAHLTLKGRARPSQCEKDYRKHTMKQGSKFLDGKKNPSRKEGVLQPQNQWGTSCTVLSLLYQKQK